MTSIEWATLDACGNDFIVINEVAGLSRPMVRAMCDRESGIGADGLLCVGDDTAEGVAVRLFNADGSDGGISGNGARCVAAWLASRGRPHGTLIFDTRAVSVARRGTGWAVDMGPAMLGSDHTGAQPDQVQEISRRTSEASDGACEVLGFGWIGNPHMIIRSSAPPGAHIDVLGPLVTRSKVFPEGINVHVIGAIRSDEVELSTWERGCGRTRACGSGACIVVAVLLDRGEAASDEVVVVRMEGGACAVRRTAAGHMELEGPVHEVSTGQWVSS